MAKPVLLMLTKTKTIQMSYYYLYTAEIKSNRIICWTT